MRKPSLYNYSKLQYIEKIINNGIYATPVENLNNPYEFKANKEKGNPRIACFTKSFNAKLMWSHYGDKHQGCTVKIKLPDDFNNEDNDYILREVNYCSNLNINKNNNNRFYNKDKKWSFEKEYRAVFDKNNYDENKW